MLIKRYLLFLILFIFFIIYFIVSLPFYSGDIKNHVVWGMSILNEGSVGFYGREFHDFSFPNYPPVSMFLFAVSVWFYQATSLFIRFLNDIFSVFPSQLVPFMEWENTKISFLKLPAILPAIGTGYFIYLISKVLKTRISMRYPYLLTLILLFNPAVIYLSAVWGQNDFLQLFFMVGAFYFLLRKNLWFSYIFAALAIMSKQTILVLWFCFLLTVFKLENLKEYLKAFMVSAVVLLLCYLPFHSFSLTWPFWFYKETLFNTTGFLASDNAINLWGLVFNFKDIDAGQKIFLLTWEKWGFVLFVVLALPIIVKFYFSKYTNERLFNFLFLITILYFFVLARMHERYLIPSIVLATVLVAFNGIRYRMNLVFFSLVQFLNLYRGLYQPDIPFLVSLVKNNLLLDGVAVCYLIILSYNYFTFMFKDNT